MKRFLLSILFVACTFQSSFALTDKIRLGFMASPGMSWFAPKGSDLKKGSVKFAMNYGLVLDYYFKDQNYGIQTGLLGGLENGVLSDRDVFTINSTKVITERYNNQYIGLPAYLKLKTNSIKKFHIYGQVGFELIFTLSSRATFSDPLLDVTNSTILPIEKENIFAKDNAVTKVIPDFRSNFFDFRLAAGAGFEYDLTDEIALMVGIKYHNGFVNVLNDRDAKKDPVLVRNLLFSVGVMF
jgi:hypothetical protein